MAKQVKTATNAAPSPETLAAVPAKRQGKGPARPSMNAPDPAGMTVEQKNPGAIVDTRTRQEIIVQDVETAFNAVQEFEGKVWGSRVGPDGTWTALVRRFVFKSADWKECRDVFKATLLARIRNAVKQENPQESFPGLDEGSYIAMVNQITESRAKGSFATVLSQFDVIGRAFAVDKHGKPISIGRDGILAILEGKPLVQQGKRVTFNAVLSQAREAVGKTGRGRKAGSTNKNPSPVKTEGKTEEKPASTMQEIVTDKDKATQMSRESCVRNIMVYLESLPNDAEILAPIVVKLGNKLKASNHKDAVDLGLMMVDLVIGSVPAAEKAA